MPDAVVFLSVKNLQDHFSKLSVWLLGHPQDALGLSHILVVEFLKTLQDVALEMANFTCEWIELVVKQLSLLVNLQYVGRWW